MAADDKHAVTEGRRCINRGAGVGANAPLCITTWLASAYRAAQGALRAAL